VVRTVLFLSILLAFASSLVAGPVVEPAPGDLPDSPHPWRVWESQRRTAMLESAAKMAGDRGLGDPEPNQLQFDVQTYDITLDLDLDDEMLTGTVVVLAEVTDGPISELVLNLLRTMTADAVRVAGEPTSFSHPLDHLTVTLDRSYATGELVEVAIDYHGDPAAAGRGFGWAYAQGEKLVWTLSEPYNARNWWPCKDFNFDKADAVDLRVTIDDPWIVASNGLLVNEQTSDGHTTYHWQTRYPIATYLVSITAYPYATFTDTYTALDGTSMPIDNYVVPSYESDARAGYGEVPAMITAFREAYGEYPFLDEKYGHAHFTWGGGMEHQTCSSMIYWFHGENLIAHELAHQWWGDLVTCADFHHIWLNEGFATWSEAYWRERSEGVDAYHDEMAASKYLGSGTIYVEDPNNFETIFDVDLSYNKASWVVHMLRGMLGDEDFFAALALYRERFAYASATTEDLQEVMEEISGRDLENFFQRWIYGSGYPRYRFAYIFETMDDHTLVHARIEQLQDEGVFEMPIKLRLHSTGGETERVVENTRRVQHYLFEAPLDLYGVSFDPDEWILRSVIFDGIVDAPEASAALAISARPNPFNPHTTLRLEAPRAGAARVVVFDARGRRVRTLLDAEIAAGVTDVRWDGRDHGGREVAAGVYFAVFEQAGRQETTRLALVR
jgi:aminopeptidase N